MTDVPPRPNDQASVLLIEALAHVWARIQEFHPKVPHVVLLPAPAGKGGMNVLGHFAALRWSGRNQATHHHEVVVVAEHLNRGAGDIAETLIHEAAHAMNFEQGIKDCSKNQYHNQRYAQAATELGLTVEQVPHYGFAYTKLPPETAARYQPEIEALDTVLIHRRPVTAPLGPGPTPGNDDPGDDGKPSSRSRKATCKCPFIIRVSKQTMLSTFIRCESCGERFVLV
jgi:hypothetical protein